MNIEQAWFRRINIPERRRNSPLELHDAVHFEPRCSRDDGARSKKN